MRIHKTLKSLTVALACAGLLGGQVAQAAAPIQDVGLQAGGRLVGQVVDSQAVPQPGVRLAVVSSGEPIAYADTDVEGRFEVRGLTAGVYGIQTSQSGSVYRVWAPHTAPPAASEQAMIISDGTVVRGQQGPGLGWLGSPWCLAAIVAAAIAIPLAIDDEGS